jgi:hypothetical protein
MRRRNVNHYELNIGDKVTLCNTELKVVGTYYRDRIWEIYKIIPKGTKISWKYRDLNENLEVDDLMYVLTRDTVREDMYGCHRRYPIYKLVPWSAIDGVYEETLIIPSNGIPTSTNNKVTKSLKESEVVTRTEHMDLLDGSVYIVQNTTFSDSPYFKLNRKLIIW